MISFACLENPFLLFNQDLPRPLFLSAKNTFFCCYCVITIIPDVIVKSNLVSVVTSAFFFFKHAIYINTNKSN